MRDLMASCVGDDASSCSSSISTYSAAGAGAAAVQSSVPSIKNRVSSVYRIMMSKQNHKTLTVTATWTKTGGTISFGDDPSKLVSIEFIKTKSSTIPFRKKKNKCIGNRAFKFHDSEIDVFWDLSSAKYDLNLGPEPVSRFYVVIMVDSELGLKLGDMVEEFEVFRRIQNMGSVAKCSLIYRREYFFGNSDLRLRNAKFSENGNPHEVSIRFHRERLGFRSPTMSVWIDRKNVMRVKSLQWNFRGNQTIFVDGLLVDLIWDVHGWLFDHHHHLHRRENDAGAGAGAGAGGAVMFRTRSEDVDECRLWLETDLMDKRQDQNDEFWLVIYATNT